MRKRALGTVLKEMSACLGGRKRYAGMSYDEAISCVSEDDLYWAIGRVSRLARRERTASGRDRMCSAEQMRGYLFTLKRVVVSDGVGGLRYLTSDERIEQFRELVRDPLRKLLNAR
jgi:hypothetical protein